MSDKTPESITIYYPVPKSERYKNKFSYTVGEKPSVTTTLEPANGKDAFKLTQQVNDGKSKKEVCDGVDHEVKEFLQRNADFLKISKLRDSGAIQYHHDEQFRAHRIEQDVISQQLPNVLEKGKEACEGKWHR